MPEITSGILFKVLGPNGEAFNGGHGRWHLPTNGKPGRWMPKIQGELIPCENGYHLCYAHQLLEWLGPKIAIAEARGERIEQSDKIVVRQARLLQILPTWNDRTARLFACDCAEWALSLIKDPDPRSIDAIVVSRRFVLGEASRDDLISAWAAARAAAWDAAGDANAAAWAAARAAAWAAARAAAWDASAAARDAARDASSAAWAAARDAARDASAAARAAARDAAWAAAWDASAAARDAAWAAAQDAAGAAAWAAAQDAAWAAAWDAAGAFMTDQLLAYLSGIL